MRLFFSALFLALTLVSPARATDLTASAIDVTFHIAHPAKEYDAKLLKDGATATATFDPGDLSTLTLDTSIRVEFFNSDNKRRDSHMIETLEGLVFPTIEWTVSSVKGLSGPVSAGTYEFIAVGPMTLHGVTKDLEIPVQLVIDDAKHPGVAKVVRYIETNYRFLKRIPCPSTMAAYKVVGKDTRAWNYHRNF